MFGRAACLLLVAFALAASVRTQGDVARPAIAAACASCSSAGAPGVPAVTSAASSQDPGGGGLLTDLVDTTDFPPRWHCGTWTELHGWVHIVADLTTWFAYMAIPATLLLLLRRRRDVPFPFVLGLFVAFIVCCGLTHLFEAVMFWWPAYRLMGLVKVVTALVSLVTAVAMVFVLPKVLSLRSPAQLEVEVRSRTREVEDARAVAQALADAKARFTANISHELRTPMSALLGYTEVLAGAADLSPELREAVAIIQRNGQHLLRVVNDVLEVSRLAAGKLPIEPEPACLRTVVRDCVEMLRPQAAQKGVDLAAEFDGEPPPLAMFDPTRVRQILINLLGNAVKFTEAGEVRATVRCSAGRGGRIAVAIEVQDSGIGMTPDQAGKVFDEFGQADATTVRRFGGTGLGLTISRQLAEAMGGQLAVVRTQPGVGTTMGLTVELALASDEDVRAFEQRNCQRATLHLEGLRVLVAEDAPDTRRLLRTSLKQAGALVECVQDGAEAIAAASAARAEGRSFAVILMDVQMPSIDGLTAVRRLRELGHDEVMLALTANTGAADRAASQAAGCDGHLAKPFRRVELVQGIARHLPAIGKGVGGSMSTGTKPS